jgi:N-acetylglucosamine-6-phosphate deacetylase
LLLTGARIVLENEVVEDGWLRIQGGVIEGVGRGVPSPPGEEEAVDCTGMTIAPGFVDIHVHGGGGQSYLDGEPSAVATARAYHRLRGTTCSLASLFSAPVEDLCAALARLAECVDSGVISGVHLEGPFISPACCGAHDPRHLLAPDPAVMSQLIDAGRGTVRMVTIAPELDGAMELIPLVRDAGAVCAIGHSEATFEIASAAIDAGATVATHLWNAMRPLHHRNPGVVGAFLLRHDTSAEVIADGLHLDPRVLELTAEVLGERMVFVSDATAAAGMSDGTVRIGSVDLDVADGVARVHESGRIAGSTATLASMVRHAVVDAGVGLLDAVNAASSRPAKLVGLGDEHGVLAAGRPADVVLLDDSLEVASVMVGERLLDESPAG